MLKAPASQASSVEDKVNHLLSQLMRVGWSDLFLNYFTKENAMDADMDLVDWILRGHIYHDHDNPREISAWVAIQGKGSLNNYILPFFRRSNGDINFADETGQTILHVFLRQCLYEPPRQRALRVVEKLLELGASTNIVDRDNFTPLHIAVEKGEIAVARALLPSFSNVTAASGLYGATVLHDLVHASDKIKGARQHEILDMAQILLDKGADPNASNKFGMTPLQLAVEYNLYGMLPIFQSHGADFGFRTSGGEGLLHFACQKKRDPSSQLRIVEFLAKQGCDVNAKNKDDFTPTHLAAKLHLTDIIQALIRLGGNVNSTTKYLRFTPLHLAVSYNRSSNVEILLNAGAEVDAEAINGVTPLHIAASRDGIQKIQYLIERGADVNRRETSFGFTPLHIAATRCKKKVELLLKQGVDANAPNHDDVTPLHLAALIGNWKVVQVLLGHGVHANCRGAGFNLTPLHLASMSYRQAYTWIFKNKDMHQERYYGMYNYGNGEGLDKVATARLLVEKAGLDVNAKDAAGRTPLHLATLHASSKLIEPLLKLGAHLDEIDDEDRSPLRNAVESGCVEGLKCLLTFGLDINDEEDDDMVNNSRNRSFALLLSHAKKMRALGLPVRDFPGECLGVDERTTLEVNRLQSCVIPGSDVTLYEFLRMSTRQRATLAEAVMSMDLEAEFPNFCVIVQGSCRQAVGRMALIGPATNALNRVTNFWWPEICAERVLSYLKDRHLRPLIASADDDDVVM